MATSAVEEIKIKVEHLVQAYHNKDKDFRELRAENMRLRNLLDQSDSKSENTEFDKAQLLKKVDTLINEVDKCVKIVAK